MEFKYEDSNICPYKIQFIPCILFKNLETINTKRILVPSRMLENKEIFRVYYEEERNVFEDKFLETTLKILTNIKINNKFPGIEKFQFKTILFWMFKNNKIPKSNEISIYDFLMQTLEIMIELLKGCKISFFWNSELIDSKTLKKSINFVDDIINILEHGMDSGIKWMIFNKKEMEKLGFFNEIQL